MTDDNDRGFFAAASVQQTLGQSTDADSCVALSHRMNGLLGSALTYFQTEQGIACQAGCNFCCHLRVMVYPHEAVALAHHLTTQMPAEQGQQVRVRLRENARRLLQHPTPATTERIPCAFLVEGRCSAYEVRPSACAGYHSLSRAACEQDHEGAASGAGAGIPMSQAMQHVGNVLDEGLKLGFTSVRLRPTRIELHTIVDALVDNPALANRWRSGREWTHDSAGLLRLKNAR